MNDFQFSAEGNVTSPPPMTEKQMQTRAHRDAIQAIAKDMPDPAMYSRYMPLELAELLMKAKFEDGWRVSIEGAKLLRPHGLIEAGTTGRFLTAFGMAVRRELIAEDA